MEDFLKEGLLAMTEEERAAYFEKMGHRPRRFDTEDSDFELTPRDRTNDNSEIISGGMLPPRPMMYKDLVDQRVDPDAPLRLPSLH